MILSNVNIGTGPSAGDGDPLRSAFTIINNNFQTIENNVNALTNSVNSVAGRTGNVILTVNDIVGLSNAYAISSATTTANTGMKGYVDQANSIQSGQVGAANLAIIAANLGMKGYVDSVASQSIYGNVNVKAYTESMGFTNFSNVNVAAYIAGQGITGGSYSNVNAISLITSLGLSNYSNVNVKAYAETMGFQNFGNVNVAAYVTTANSAILGYIDLANTIQSAQVNAANLATIAANLGMKGYVDSVASQSIYGNANVASFLPTYSGNLNANYATFTGDNGNGLNALSVGVPGIEIFGNTIAQFHSNVNYPVHLTVHNKNTGNQSTSGFMATADVGDSNTDYGIMAIAGSNWSPPAGHFLKPLETILVAAGGNLVLATTLFNGANASPKDIVFVTSTGVQPENSLETLRIHTEPGLLSANLQLGANVGILFNDGTRQTSAYSNVQTAAFTNLSTYAYNANVTAANLGMKGYVDSIVGGGSNYGNSNVASYLPIYGGNLSAKYATITGDDADGLNALSVGVPGIEIFSNVIAQFHSNVNSPVHLAVHNKNTGNQSTSGFIATADIGDENTNLSIMAIAGSNWAPPGGHFLKPLDSVMVGVGGNLVLATTLFNGANASPKDIVFVTSTGVQPQNTLEVLRIHAENNLSSANLELGANVGIKFSDGTRQTTAATGGGSNYGNANVTAYTVSMGFTNFSNVNVSALITTNGLTNYSNVNVKAYAETMGYQNYGNANVAALITTNGLTNYSNVNVIAYLAGNITVGNIAGSVNGFDIGYRDVPQITVANLTLIASDAGKHYYGANTNPTTITIPTNANVAFGNGTAISIVNQGTGNITVANAAGVLLYLAGNSTAGSRTLTSYGMATLIKVQVNTWFINGSGVV